MKPLLTIIAVWVITAVDYSFAYLPPTPTGPENTPTILRANSKIITSLEPSSRNNNPSTTARATLQPAGRNLQFPSFHEDVFEFAPIPNNFRGFPYHNRPILDVGPAISPFEPYPFEIDFGAIHHFPPIGGQPPIGDFKVAYPLDFDEHVMAPVGRQIVFRPLFAYRNQNSQRRRIDSSNPTASSSYSTNCRYGQRRQGYSNPYRYSSNSYRNRYPDYYNNAPYDNVP